MSKKRMVLSSLLLCAVASTASAFNPQPEPPGFGMLGITSNQIARLNISFGAPPDPDDRAFPPGPCRGTLHLRFSDATGNVLAEKNVRILAGTSDALELPGGLRGSEGVPLSGGLAVAGRTQIRAIVSWAEYPPGPCRNGALFGNVEIVNASTGETTVVLPGVMGAFGRSGD